MYVVTGATGYVGGVLVRTLLKAEEKVRVVIPPFENQALLKDLDVEVVVADIRDYDAIEAAIHEDDIVIHVAGFVTIMPGDQDRLNRINVLGTGNVVNACLKKKAKRMVYVSSVHAFPELKGIISEDTSVDPLLAYGHYGKSKAQATLRVWNGVRRGLDAVIVHPSGIFGPFDYHERNRLTHVIRGYMEGKQKALIAGGYDFVDVRDVAEGIYLAAIRGRKGQNYILSGNFVTIREMVNALSQITGKKMPKRSCPKGLAKFCAPFVEAVALTFRRYKPLLTRYALHTLWTHTRFDNSKARRELGWNPRGFKESLRDMVRWFLGQPIEQT